jgi:hypothetical protein
MRRALRLLALLVLAARPALVAAIFRALEDRPLVAGPPALGPGQIEPAKRILDDNDPRRLKTGAQRTVSLSQQDPGGYPAMPPMCSPARSPVIAALHKPST